MYASIGMQGDLCYAVSSLSRYLKNPEYHHWKAAKHVLRYLKGTTNHAMEYNAKELVLRGYADADWGADKEDRRSITGYVFLLGDAAISTKSRKQPTVSESSTEAEYMATYFAVSEAMYLCMLLKELGHEQATTVIRVDNQACITIASKPVLRSRVKHIDMKYHFIREHVMSKDIDVTYISTKDQVADILTKALPASRFEKHCEAMGLGTHRVLV